MKKNYISKCRAVSWLCVGVVCLVFGRRLALVGRHKTSLQLLRSDKVQKTLASRCIIGGPACPVQPNTSSLTTAGTEETVR